MFLSLLPLKAAGREQLLLDLKEMDVPTDKLIGGKLMGMLDIPGLSGGQRKKLLLALSVQMAVARDAKAMVLDEPFAGIDADSMPRVLQVLKRVESQRDTKVFLVTHDHFQLIEDAFPGTPVLKIDHRQLHVVAAAASKQAQVGVSAVEAEDPDDDRLNTAVAANIMAQSIHSASARGRKNAKPQKPPLVDPYVIKRYFVEGEQMLPSFTILVFGTLSGIAAGRYHGHGNGILGLSITFAFLKAFMLEYIHFGLILNYAYKRAQHIEDVNLMVTMKKDAIVETVIIASVQAIALAFLLNGLLIAIGPRFWWVNSNILIIDAFYALLVQCAYTLLPIVQPNPCVLSSCLRFCRPSCLNLHSQAHHDGIHLPLHVGMVRIQRLHDPARVRPQELALVHPLLAHLPLRLRRRQSLRRPNRVPRLELRQTRHPPRLPLAPPPLHRRLHRLYQRPRRPLDQEELRRRSGHVDGRRPPGRTRPNHALRRQRRRHVRRRGKRLVPLFPFLKTLLRSLSVTPPSPRTTPPT